MPNTMTLISSSTVNTSTASSVSFTSVPQTYTDLLLKISARIGDANTWYDFSVAFNGITTGYSGKFLYGAGASIGTGSDAGAGIQVRTSTTANTANTFGSAELYIPNYTSSANKAVNIDQVSENNATSAIALLTTGLWANSAAITSITITPISGDSFVQYSTFYLYGIKNS